MKTVFLVPCGCWPGSHQFLEVVEGPYSDLPYTSPCSYNLQIFTLVFLYRKSQSDESIDKSHPYTTKTVQTTPQEEGKKPETKKAKEDMMLLASQRIILRSERVCGQSQNMCDFVTQYDQGLRHIMRVIRDICTTFSM